MSIRMTKGKLIVFEGIDGSGKSTQFEMMCQKLDSLEADYMRLVFPQYSEPSSALIRMYLNGEFGKNPGDVNAYAASAFYAVDRYASYVRVWRDFYLAGGAILADRYTTSNAIHQACKLPEDEQEHFFKWLGQFEYENMELPEPDIVIYMDITLEAASKNMRAREAMKGFGGDIHETDNDYLAKCLLTAERASDFYGWHRVNCIKRGLLRAPEDIHEEISEIIDRV